ncbi:MAG: enoyl-CoA hydratase/isomerase family protein [Ignavibacteria bacterium]|nr:enoyl-CoA hydratase/isomerase family protein [Ignavibacteria bacterium]
MIKYETKDEIGILTLNRPEKRNALHPELVKQMKSKLKEVEKDESVKILIITGEGKAFCAGADLEYLNQIRTFSSLENEKDSRELAELFLMINSFSKIVIAAVNGAAIAGGCGLASVCDIIVADEANAKFGYSEVKIGFIPALVSTFLIRKVGEGMAKQLLLSGEIIESKRAYEIGFVNYLYSNALTGTLDVAYKLKDNSLQSMELTKMMINKVSGLSVEDAVEYCIGLNTISRTTEDFKEGLNNFLTKK